MIAKFGNELSSVEVCRSYNRPTMTVSYEMLLGSYFTISCAFLKCLGYSDERNRQDDSLSRDRPRVMLHRPRICNPRMVSAVNVRD